MRKQVKRPLTSYAAKLVLEKLAQLHASGEDINACLEQSIRNGWMDVFPLRADKRDTAEAEIKRLWEQTPQPSPELKNENPLE